MKTILLSIILSATSFAFAGDLTVNVSNLKSDKGEVFVALWDSSKGFPDDYRTSIETVTVKTTLPVTTVTIENLPDGEYAMAVFHDKNSDETLNTNMIGIPKEAFGFSNNPKLYFGPPKFRKAKFKVNSSATTKKIILKYY